MKYKVVIEYGGFHGEEILCSTLKQVKQVYKDNKGGTWNAMYWQKLKR